MTDLRYTCTTCGERHEMLEPCPEYKGCKICGASNDMEIAEMCEGTCMGTGGYKKERSMEVSIRKMDDLDSQNPNANRKT